MASYKETYDRQGFVIVPNLISSSDFSELVAACDRAVSRTRAGDWPYRRTVGKQYPPWNEESPDSWGVQHVMNPDLGEAAFARWYTSNALLQVVQELLDCKEEHLQMELFNLLINPTSHRFALSWHRDDVKPDATEQEEEAALRIWHHGVQWNTALYEDSALYVVPQTHDKARTTEQRTLSSDSKPPESPLDMPGAIQVTLKAGETVFYNSNILHCAAYSPDSKRATLHACVGDVRGGSARSRNVLQHNLSWMKDAKFRATLTPKGQTMLDRLLEMEKGSSGKLEYSLDG